MEEGQVLELLRAAGTQGAPPMRHFPARALAAGKRARRRRRFLALSASGTVLAGAAALVVVLAPGNVAGHRAVTMTPAQDGGSGQNTPAPAPAAPAPTAAAGIDATVVLAEGLGADFGVDDEHRVALKPGTQAAQGLPAGWEFTAIAWTPVGGNDEEATLCAMAEEFEPCTDVPVSRGRVVRMALAKVDQPSSERTVRHRMNLVYRQVDGGLVSASAEVAHAYQNSPTPPGHAAARAWLVALAPRVGEAMVSPHMEPPVPPDRLAADQQALLDALGPDFTSDEGHSVVAVPGSAAAQAMPEGFETFIYADSGYREGEESLRALCEQEPDPDTGHNATCTPMTLPDGRVVQVRWTRVTPVGPQPWEGHGLAVYFVQPDKDLIMMSASARAEPGATPEQFEQARGWLEDLLPKLVAAATDPYAAPRDPSTAG